MRNPDGHSNIEHSVGHPLVCKGTRHVDIEYHTPRVFSAPNAADPSTKMQAAAGPWMGMTPEQASREMQMRALAAEQQQHYHQQYSQQPVSSGSVTPANSLQQVIGGGEASESSSFIPYATGNSQRKQPANSGGIKGKREKEAQLAAMQQQQQQQQHAAFEHQQRAQQHYYAQQYAQHPLQQYPPTPVSAGSPSMLPPLPPMPGPATQQGPAMADMNIMPELQQQPQPQFQYNLPPLPQAEHVQFHAKPEEPAAVEAVPQEQEAPFEDEEFPTKPQGPRERVRRIHLPVREGMDELSDSAGDNDDEWGTPELASGETCFPAGYDGSRRLSSYRKTAKDGKIKPSYYYPTESSGTRGVPVFEPSYEDFHDFNSFIAKIDNYGMRSGIVKIVPPKEWFDTLKSVSQPLKDTTIREPIEQHFQGSRGIFRQSNVASRRIYNIKQWKDMCDNDTYRTPDFFNIQAKPNRHGSHDNLDEEEVKLELPMPRRRPNRPAAPKAVETPSSPKPEPIQDGIDKNVARTQKAREIAAMRRDRIRSRKRKRPSAPAVTQDDGSDSPLTEQSAGEASDDDAEDNKHTSSKLDDDAAIGLQIPGNLSDAVDGAGDGDETADMAEATFIAPEDIPEPEETQDAQDADAQSTQDPHAAFSEEAVNPITTDQDGNMIADSDLVNTSAAMVHIDASLDPAEAPMAVDEPIVKADQNEDTPQTHLPSPAATDESAKENKPITVSTKAPKKVPARKGRPPGKRPKFDANGEPIGPKRKPRPEDNLADWDREWAEFDYESLPWSAKPSDFTLNQCKNIERQYWKRFSLGAPPMYGADGSGSLFDDSVKDWNIASLDDLLMRVNPHMPMPGVNTPYLYFGMWRATFAWHVEDADLYSINYIHFGAPKFWYSIPQTSAERFERVMGSHFPYDQQKCPEFMRHKQFLVSPTNLANEGIPLNRCVQFPGEIILTYPYGYHSGFNIGFNCAESINFATEGWLDIGRRTKACVCFPDTVRINVDHWLSEARKDAERIKDDPEYAEMRKREREAAVIIPQHEAKKRRILGPAYRPPQPTADVPRMQPRAENSRSAANARKKTAQPFGPNSGTATKQARPMPSKPAASYLPNGQAPQAVPQQKSVPISYPCALCPEQTPDGLVRIQTERQKNRGLFAHKVCVTFTPTTWCAVNPATGKEMVYGFDQIEPARWNLKCGLCDDKHGTKIQCTKSAKCVRAFHATCALKEGSYVLLDALVNGRSVLEPLKPGEPPLGDGTLQLAVTCRQHNPQFVKMQADRKKQQHEQRVQNLPIGTQVQIRTTSGVWAVTLHSQQPAHGGVEIQFGDGNRALCKYAAILLPEEGPAKVQIKPTPPKARPQPMDRSRSSQTPSERAAPVQMPYHQAAPPQMAPFTAAPQAYAQPYSTYASQPGVATAVTGPPNHMPHHAIQQNTYQYPTMQSSNQYHYDYPSPASLPPAASPMFPQQQNYSQGFNYAT